MTYRTLMYSLALTCTICACGKKKEDPQPPTRTELLTNKKWQLRSDVFSYPGSPDEDLYKQMKLCFHDDYRQFNLPNTYVYDTGPTKCSALEPQTQLGVWALSNNDTQLTITDPNVSDTFTILELTATSLKMTMPIPQSTGINAIATLVYEPIK